MQPHSRSAYRVVGVSTFFQMRFAGTNYHQYERNSSDVSRWYNRPHRCFCGTNPLGAVSVS